MPRASVFFLRRGRLTQRSFAMCSCPSHLFGSGVCRPFGVFPCAGTVGALSDIVMCVCVKIFEVDVCATNMRDSCDGRQSVRNLADYKTILELVAMNDAGTVPAVSRSCPEVAMFMFVWGRCVLQSRFPNIGFESRLFSERFFVDFECVIDAAWRTSHGDARTQWSGQHRWDFCDHPTMSCWKVNSNTSANAPPSQSPV